MDDTTCVSAGPRRSDTESGNWEGGAEKVGETGPEWCPREQGGQEIMGRWVARWEEGAQGRHTVVLRVCPASLGGTGWADLQRKGWQFLVTEELTHRTEEIHRACPTEAFAPDQGHWGAEASGTPRSMHNSESTLPQGACITAPLCLSFSHGN